MLSLFAFSNSGVTAVFDAEELTACADASNKAPLPSLPLCLPPFLPVCLSRSLSLLASLSLTLAISLSLSLSPSISPCLPLSLCLSLSLPPHSLHLFVTTVRVLMHPPAEVGICCAQHWPAFLGLVFIGAPGR